ncbi:kielin/chordin-like protein [Saccostrea echinata]|uniref:kielin/chordin-like protein n=1 Tax=Saccostrea echinata TaxID=191078 RepID=UPI002A808E70|nr:kielin/chordin-like protein [Saccostrea echinata]
MKYFNLYLVIFISLLNAVDLQCTHLGRVYEPDVSFPKGDACNVCKCGDSGNVRCTDRRCHQYPKCRHNGKMYDAGSRFPSRDGCNECICTTIGVPQCTMYNCYPDCTYNGQTYKKGDIFPKGDKCNNYCTCTVIGKVQCAEDLSCYLS